MGEHCRHNVAYSRGSSCADWGPCGRRDSATVNLGQTGRLPGSILSSSLDLLGVWASHFLWLEPVSSCPGGHSTSLAQAEERITVHGHRSTRLSISILSLHCRLHPLLSVSLLLMVGQMAFHTIVAMGDSHFELFCFMFISSLIIFLSSLASYVHWEAFCEYLVIFSCLCVLALNTE